MTAPAWYPDPTGRYEMRWWDGGHWTADVIQHGQQSVDPWPVETAGVAATHPADPGPPSAVPEPPAMPPTVVSPTVPTPTTQFPTVPAAAPTPAWGTPHTDAPLPTAPPPMSHPIAPAAPPAARSNRTPLLVGGGIAAAAALAVAGFLVLGGDDDKAVTPATSTTVAATSTLATSTTVAGTSTSAATTTTATETTPAPSTTPVDDPFELLFSAMPAAGEVPDSWVAFDESVAAEPSDDDGYCGGPNWAAQAIASGAEAGIHGPNWDIEAGGWFGVSAFTFPTADAASAFVTNIDLQANGCMTDPVTYTTPESEMDLFIDGNGDDAVWNVADNNGSFPGTVPYADEMTLVIYEQFISTNVDSTDYSVTRTELQRFERHGRTVLAFWLWGEHSGVGFSDAADWEYEPTEADLDAAAATIRPLVVERLSLSGLV